MIFRVKHRERLARQKKATLSTSSMQTSTEKEHNNTNSTLPWDYFDYPYVSGLSFNYFGFIDGGKIRSMFVNAVIGGGLSISCILLNIFW